MRVFDNYLLLYSAITENINGTRRLLIPRYERRGDLPFSSICVVGQPPLLWLRSRCVGIWMYFKGHPDPAVWGWIKKQGERGVAADGKVKRGLRINLIHFHGNRKSVSVSFSPQATFLLSHLLYNLVSRLLSLSSWDSLHVRDENFLLPLSSPLELLPPCDCSLPGQFPNWISIAGCFGIHVFSGDRPKTVAVKITQPGLTGHRAFQSTVGFLFELQQISWLQEPNSGFLCIKGLGVFGSRSH